MRNFYNKQPQCKEGAMRTTPSQGSGFRVRQPASEAGQGVGFAELAHRKRSECPTRTGALLALALLLGFASAAHADLAPDLTVSTTRFTTDTSVTFCLGPTGMRGWIYVPLWYGTPGYWDGYNYCLDRITSFSNWQVLVTSVGTGTPAFAAGILSNDVILGVKAGFSGAVPAFTNDTRKELGNAITAAEATNGILRLLINRYGVGSNQIFTLQLNMSNMAYSATAPFNCPKSALLLSNALKVVSSMTISRSQALALLASGDTNYLPQVIAYARSIAPTNWVAPWPGTTGEGSWDMGYNCMFLAEYYMITNDPLVVNGLVQRATMMAKSDTKYGCSAHGGAFTFPYNANAGMHGTCGGYGPVNAGGLLCKLGVALAKQTGLQGVVTNAEVQPALDRSRQFFGFIVNKGYVPYGEHACAAGPYGYGHSAGKNSLAALFFAALGSQPTQVQYFSRLTLEEYADTESFDQVRA